MLQPIYIAFGQYLSGYYQGLAPTTKALQEFVGRGLDKSMVWAPGRMVDQAEEMISAWQRNDTDQGPTHPASLPVIFVAVAKDYTPTGRDYGRQISEVLDVIVPGDAKERYFGLRVVMGDIRAQLVFAAAEEASAKSLAAQFSLFLDDIGNRRFFANFRFAGQDVPYPVQIETADVPAMNIASGSKNLTILAMDLTLRASIPLYKAPKGSEPNDGKGQPGSATNPAGYPLVTEVTVTKQEPQP